MMRVEQISVFLENKEGRVAQVTSILSASSVNIRALSLADTADFGVLRLIVDDTSKAENVLKDKGFTVGKTHVVAVEVEDKPGGLNDILQILHEAKINVEYMYAFVRQSGNKAVMIFRFDDIEAAVGVLESKGVGIIPGKDLYSM